MDLQDSYGVAKIFLDAKFYLGLITIVLYAKDKFNMPTYNRDAMGPFAQLSPQLLTVDSRYRRGRMVYLASMIFLYTALCIVGPTTLQSLDVPFAKAADDAFPVAAAAFLVSTAAASDSSWLGKIELFIRQYAHKAAYIPTAVSDLAFNLRSVNISEWLIPTDGSVDAKELKTRQGAIQELAGEFAFKRVTEDPGQEGTVASWVRANILFYLLQEIFGRRKVLANSKLDYLVELPENRENLERIQTDRAAILAKLPADGDADKVLQSIYPEVQRFTKLTSLTLAVLMSQAARSSNFLNVHLDQLGLRSGYLRDRSDHFAYTALTNAFILLAALLTGVILGGVVLRAYSADKWSEQFTALAITVGTGIVSYVTLFAILDYMRDKLLDSMDWQENLEGCVRLVIPGALIAAIGCTVLVILGFALFGLGGLLGSVVIIQNLILQIIIASLAAAFGVGYLRRAARLRPDQISFWSPAMLVHPILHGLIAVVLVGGLNYGVNQYNLASETQQRLDQIASLIKKVRDQSASDKPKTGFFSGKDPKHIAQLLGDVNRATGVAQAYISNPRGLSPWDVKSNQLAELERACNQLQLYVVAPDETYRQWFWNDKCGLDVDVTASDEADQTFVSLAKELSGLVDALGRSDYMALVFSSVASFLFAFLFGVGLTYWRAWWLNNEIDRPDGEISKLEEQAKRAFGEDIRFKEFLVHPLMAVNGLTPLEAVRYEDYRGKLFTDVQKKDPEIGRVLRAQPATG